ncbi:hypothetical protein WJX72_008292 [[Myrmecia] bisecta]|uniref:Uncharacterized protein n=1 Tax=[Myrmecia] bisecta TaxID=41462 RepID=A0AAW1PXE9_9CHLO
MAMLQHAVCLAGGVILRSIKVPHRCARTTCKLSLARRKSLPQTAVSQMARQYSAAAGYSTLHPYRRPRLKGCPASGSHELPDENSGAQLAMNLR